MKRLLIISFVLLLSGIVFAGPPAIPPKDLIEVSANCNQSQYYVLGKVCQSSVDGKLYKGDGNQIIELGDMLGAFYASEGRIRPLRGGTGIDSSGLSGFPLVTSGVWSVLNNAGVKSALGYLTSTDYPVTGVASPTAGMIPKWGVSGNTLVDGYDVTAFQAALTNPVTGVASPSAGYLTKWGLSGNSIVDGLKIGTMTDGKVCTFSDTDGMECDTTITGGGSMVYPSAGIPVSTGEGWGSPATYSNITGLWASGACSGYLKSDGSCDTPSGGSGGYTNLTSFIDQTAWRLFYSDGSGDVKELALGTNGQYLMSNGASAVPSWGTPSGGSGFDVAGNYTPTGVWNWGTVGAGTTWPTFNQNTTGNAATATTATSATTATNLSNYSVLYNGSMTDGHMVSYRSADGKLQDAGAPVAYTPPALNAPLCGASGAGVGACTNLTDTAIPTAYTDIVGMWASGSCTGYLKSDGSCDTPSGGGNGIDYTPPEDPAPLCSDITGAIIACTNLKDQDLAEIEGSADDIGVKVETISTDPEEVIECEGKDRNYIVGFDEPSFFQLPADPTGVRYCFGNNDYGAAISIVPDGTDTITHGGTATGEGEGLVSGGSAQDWVCLLGLSSSKWRTISSLGTWTIDEVTLPEPEPPVGDCTTPTGNVFTESFGEGTSLCWTGGPETCNNTWTIAGGPFLIADVPEGAPPNTACSKGLLIDSADSGSALSMRYDLDTSAPASNVKTIVNMSVYVDSSSAQGYGSRQFFNYNSLVTDASPNGFFYLVVRHTGEGVPADFRTVGTSGCNIKMELDTWFNLTITLDAAAEEDGSTVSDGTNSCNFTRNTYAGTKYLHLGSPAEQKLYIGNIRVSTEE